MIWTTSIIKQFQVAGLKLPELEWYFDWVSKFLAQAQCKFIWFENNHKLQTLEFYKNSTHTLVQFISTVYGKYSHYKQPAPRTTP
jgi:hypothetical protein